MTLRLSKRDFERLARNQECAPRPRRTALTPAVVREPWCRAGRAENGSYCVTAWVPMLPPSTNRLHRAARQGGKCLTPEAETFERYLMAALTPRPAVPAGRYRLTVTATFGTRQRQDDDNRVKWARDCIARAFGFDDAAIIETVSRAGYDPGRPACELVLEVLP